MYTKLNQIITSNYSSALQGPLGVLKLLFEHSVAVYGMGRWMQGGEKDVGGGRGGGFGGKMGPPPALYNHESSGIGCYCIHWKTIQSTSLDDEFPLNQRN